MAITIFPRDEQGPSWSDAIGKGLSAGLGALMEGKVQQLRNRYGAQAYERAGMDPNIAYLPKDIQKQSVKQLFDNQKSSLAQQRERQDYMAVRNDALSKGISPASIQTADALSGNKGIKYLTDAVKDIGKDRSPSGAFNWFMGGKTPSIHAATPREKARYEAMQRKEARDQQQIQQQAQPTQEAVKNQQQQEYNTQYFANQPQKTESTVEHMNQAAAEQVAHGNNIGQPMTEEDQDRQLLEEMEKDPTIIPEELDYYRLNLTGGPKSFGERVASFPTNLASGATQSVGTGLGLLPLAESATKSFLDLLPSPEKYRKDLEKIKEDNPEGSKEREFADRLLKQIDYAHETKDEKIFPTPRDIKEKVVRPVAKALGIERLTDVSDAASNIAERIGFVTPQMLLANAFGMGPGLAKSAATAAIAETGGYTAENLSDSPLVGALTSLAIYGGSNFVPGAIKKYTSKAYSSFGRAVENAAEKGAIKNADGSSVAQAIENIQNSMVAKSTPEAHFIKPILEDVNSLIKRNGSYAQKNGLPRVSISPEKAWKLDQDLGGNTLEKARDLGGKATDMLYQARSALRSIYQPAMNAIDPKATQDLIASRNILSALNAKDIVQETFNKAGRSNVGFFNKYWYTAKKGAQSLAQVLKFVKPLVTSDEYRKFAGNLVKDGLTKNVPGVQESVRKIFEDIEKKKKRA